MIRKSPKRHQRIITASSPLGWFTLNPIICIITESQKAMVMQLWTNILAPPWKLFILKVSSGSLILGSAEMKNLLVVAGGEHCHWLGWIWRTCKRVDKQVKASDMCPGHPRIVSRVPAFLCQLYFYLVEVVLIIDSYWGNSLFESYFTMFLHLLNGRLSLSNGLSF